MENKENKKKGDLHTLFEESVGRGAKRKDKERGKIEVHREKRRIVDRNKTGRHKSRIRDKGNHGVITGS